MNEELNAILQKQIIGKDDPRFEFFSDDFYGDFYVYIHIYKNFPFCSATKLLLKTFTY